VHKEAKIQDKEAGQKIKDSRGNRAPPSQFSSLSPPTTCSDNAET